MGVRRNKSRKSIAKKILYYFAIALIASASIYKVLDYEPSEAASTASTYKNYNLNENRKDTNASQEENIVEITENKNNRPLEKVRALLNKYGLDIRNILSVESITIPEGTLSNPENAPINLYWTCCNEYSKAIGLDFFAYKGKEVKAYTFSTNQKEDVIVLLYKDNIVGAWIAFKSISGMSLDNKISLYSFAANWGNWLQENKIADYDNREEKVYKKLSGEETINTYFSLFNNKKYNEAFSVYSKLYQSNFLYSKNGDSKVLNSLKNFTMEGFCDDENLRVLNIKEIPIKNNNYYMNYLNFTRAVADCQYYSVTIEYNFNGQQHKDKYVMCLVKEAYGAPWKIDYYYQNLYDDY